MDCFCSASLLYSGVPFLVWPLDAISHDMTCDSGARGGGEILVHRGRGACLDGRFRYFILYQVEIFLPTLKDTYVKIFMVRIYVNPSL